MIKRRKWLSLLAITASGTMLVSGCLGAFWQGMWKTGWPSDNPWLNAAVDVLKEATIHAP